MAKVKFTINAGLPGHIGHAQSAASIKAALREFAAYRDGCERFGNTWQDAFLEVTPENASDDETRLYEYGPRGGIRKLQE